MHENDYKKMVISLGGKGDEPMFKMQSYGQMIIMPDLDCPFGLVYLCQMDTWARDPYFGTYCTSPHCNGYLIL
jgi:hypothetical protein